MKTIKELVRLYGDVWVYCKNEELQVQFLNQAENEGFIALNGQKPSELFHHKLYGLSDDMTMGYLSGMVWCYSARNPKDTIIRIDYEKYLSDEEDILYVLTESDKEYDLIEIPSEEGIKIGSKVRYIAETNWAYEKGKIYEVCGYDEEIGAWGVMSDEGEIYLVGEADIELVKDQS